MRLGIHRDIDDQAYHADPCEVPSLSSSLARTLLDQSPLHAWTESRRLNPDWQPRESATFDIGKAAHRSLLGRGAEYVEIPADLLSDDGGVRSREARAFVADARDRGVVPLKGDVIAEIEAMREAAVAHLAECRITLDPADSEVVAIAEIGACWCRAMIDNAPPAGVLYDFKTTTDASPDAIMRACINYGYDVQAAHYVETWQAASCETKPRVFRFIFQEKTPPYAVGVVQLSSDDLSMARKKTARARKLWARFCASDHWPGYPVGVHELRLPDWYAERWLEREVQEADFKAATGRDVYDRARLWQPPEKYEVTT